MECSALLGVPWGVVVKEPAQPLRCLVECYVIRAKMCVCTFFVVVYTYICACGSHVFTFSVLLFYKFTKPCGITCTSLKKKACRVKVTANVRAARINMWMFGVVFVPACRLSGTGIVLSGFVYATMMRVELLLGNTVKCARLLSACTGCV